MKRPLTNAFGGVLATVMATALTTGTVTRNVNAQTADISPQARPVQVPRGLPDQFELTDLRVDHELQALADGLADPSYQRREAAMQELLDGEFDVDQICVVLSDRTLAPEPRYRLLEVLSTQLSGSPRGAVGIRMMWLQSAPRRAGVVEVTELIPGLPAAGLLQIGDQISHVDGHRLHFQTDLTVLVQTKRPGDEVTLNVLRAQRREQGDLLMNEAGLLVREEIKVRLRLGSTARLLDPVTGRRMTASEVEDKRRSETKIASARYAPPAPIVEIVGGREHGVVIASPLPVINVAEIEANQNITQLKISLMRIEASGVAATATQKLLWKRELQRLQDLSILPDFSPRDRELFRRVAKRYEELVEAAVE